ncbi:hydantoinase/oxoprolinase family protein [Streptomyces milbemycinicus]|uniref:Hydantoinase/oxoprolinase family protein n=1 Tax=Streptomyces milbemycinicus TaxID=476552 RepID=A0ABW8LPF7_9ACTN
MKLGIDLGRATCAAVLVAGSGRVAAQAVVDSAPGTAGSLRRALAALGPLPAPVDSVALVTDFARQPPPPPPRQPSWLRRVAVLRIAPASHPALAPLADWPTAARTAVGALSAVVTGGSAVTGRPLAPLDRTAVAAFAGRARQAGVSAFAVCAAGAPARPAPELDAAAVIADAVPGAAISLSHEIGSAGLRERENATALNAALGGWAADLAADSSRALRAAGLTSPVFFARDDGGLVSAEYFRRHPVIATAPATACAARGAAARTGLARAVVVDAGARSVRCLALGDGEPERSARPVPGPLGVLTHLGSPEIHEVRPGPPGAPEGTPAEAAEAARLIAGQLARMPDAEPLYTGGGAESVGAPPADPALRAARLTDAARFAATADCRVGFEQIVAAAGRSELDRLLTAARDHTLSRAVAAGAAPLTVRIESMAHAPVAYLPAGVHRVTVRAVGRPLVGGPV